MSLLRNSSLGDYNDTYTIMFDDLSAEAQEKLSDFKAEDEIWKLLPLAQLCQEKSTLSQDEIDDTALLTAGYYK